MSECAEPADFAAAHATDRDQCRQRQRQDDDERRQDDDQHDAVGDSLEEDVVLQQRSDSWSRPTKFIFFEKPDQSVSE